MGGAMTVRALEEGLNWHYHLTFAYLHLCVYLALASLGRLAGQGVRGAFLASWILSALLLVPVSYYVYRVIEYAPQLLDNSGREILTSEKVSMVALILSSPSLGAALVVGFLVWSRWREEK
jgi:hypothetical protein